MQLLQQHLVARYALSSVFVSPPVVSVAAPAMHVLPAAAVAAVAVAVGVVAGAMYAAAAAAGAAGS